MKKSKFACIGEIIVGILFIIIGVFFLNVDGVQDSYFTGCVEIAIGAILIILGGRGFMGKKD